MSQEKETSILVPNATYQKLKKYRGNARRAIKDLLAKNEMITALWHKEIALNRARTTEYHEVCKRFFRFAKWVHPKLFPECADIGKHNYSIVISKWMDKWEKEIDQKSIE